MPRLYMLGKPLHPIEERAGKLKAKDRLHAAEIAHWVITYSPSQREAIRQDSSQPTIMRHLKTIYAELLHLTKLVACINEQVENNPSIGQYNYTSVQYYIEPTTGTPTINLKHFDKLPATRSPLVEHVRYGAVLMSNRNILKYIDLTEE